jgi:serine/threonine protein kinase
MTSAPPAEPELGSLIGGYRLDSLLGRGGTSTVYLAEHELLGRKAAVKVLAPHLAEDENFRERFVRESQLVAGIDHPNIIPIYDANEDDSGRLFLAMRYVDGGSLDGLVRSGGPLAPTRAAGVVSQIGSALDAAHARGIVHRDVKPGNVLIDASGERVYLADFGIARPASASGLTRAGAFMGTVEYIAPEQIEGKLVDWRSDVYALAGVLFYALTGRPPFEGDTEVSVLYAHIQGRARSARALNPEVPPELDAVLQRGLAKSPPARHRTAGGLGRAAVAAASGSRPAPESDEELVSPAESVIVPQPSPPAPPTPLAPPPPPPAPAPLREPPVARGDVPVVRFELDPRFRFVHEPLVDDASGVPFLENQAAVDALEERLRYSNGGSFLITGFRGVGKTTVIRRALLDFEKTADDGPLLSIFLNVARPVTTEELLFEIVRRIFEALSDDGVLDRLPPEVQRALIIAYTRTSLSFKETHSRSSERSRAVGLDLGSVPMLGRVGPKLDLSRKRTDALATEAAFLAYSHTDVEHDFLRIVELVQKPETVPQRRSWLRRLRRAARTSAPWHGRIVVVIDELDKLTASADGLKAMESILNGLKNVLATRGIHFFFVAGPDLHDVCVRESHRGNSVYESVFGWQLYVPCVWRAPERLLDELVAPADRDNAWFAALRDYVLFKARGIPRLLLLELNSLVRWEGGRPVLALLPLDAARVEFYAGLQSALTEFLEREGPGAARPLSVAIDRDRWRLGAYYVTDWILRSGGRSFTVDEIVGTGGAAAVDPTLVISRDKAEELLAHLVEREVLIQVRGRADQTFVADSPSSSEVAYRLVEDVEYKLSRFRRGNERERADLAPALGGIGDSQPWAEQRAVTVVGDGRYELRSEVARSWTGGLYAAYDRLLRRDVNVKLFEAGPDAGGPAVQRFERESEIAVTIDHPNIVSAHDTFRDLDGRRGIVLERLEGISLKELLAWGALPAPEAVRIAIALLGALEYLHAKGFARTDLKPSNIVLNESRTPIIADIGLLRRGDEQDDVVERAEELTAAGAIVATPKYSAPEQIIGGRLDIRTDLHALGLVLIEMLTGRPARPERGIREVLEAAAHEAIDLSGLHVSPQLLAVVAQAVSRDPADRFATPYAMRTALEATPEIGAGLVQSATST